MTEPTAKFKTIIEFHGMLLTVITFENKDYVQLKPIVDMLGTKWDSVRRNVFLGDNAEIYGTQLLFKPEFDVVEPLKRSKKSVHILLEATETFLMKTDTNRIRANGNEKAADYLLALQKEWRKALHDYETKGIAFKASKGSDLVKLDKIKDPHIRAEYARDINERYGMNIPIGRQTGLNV